ncbi:hypothetical protein Ancab_012607 [Ancistrocladus abbreviatus]
MDAAKLHRLLSLYLSTILLMLRHFISSLPKLRYHPIFIPLADALLALYYHSCGLSPYSVDLDSNTTIHCWKSNHKRHNRPNLVLIHGCGANARWQFCLQVRYLSRMFNLYVPDLLFFGGSHTGSDDRSEKFQAKCLMEGLRKAGLGGDEKCSLYAISYGGWVGYRMVEMYPEVVERVVILSSGVGSTVEQLWELVEKIGRRAEDLLVPEVAEDLKMLVKTAVYKYNPEWIPNFFLKEFINVMDGGYKKERRELVQNLLARKASFDLPPLNQETLLIWGDQDNVFPLYLAYQLKRHLGPKARLEILKDTGHAANLDSPHDVNKLIKSFVLDGYENKFS